MFNSLFFPEALVLYEIIGITFSKWSCDSIALTLEIRKATVSTTDGNKNYVGNIIHSQHTKRSFMKIHLLVQKLYAGQDSNV
jgi:hypothetical protein